MLVTPAETQLSEETGSQLGSETPHPRPGTAPNVTAWGWGPHPLPIGEDVKVEMQKSREKVQQNQEGAQNTPYVVAACVPRRGACRRQPISDSLAALVFLSFYIPKV